MILSRQVSGTSGGEVKDFQAESIVDHLCNNMIGDKEQLRDISSIGLKTVNYL